MGCTGSAENVTTHNIAARQNAYREMNGLRVKTSAGLTGTVITAATQDARNAAARSAKDPGSRVGSIRTESQGIFQITTPGLEGQDPASVQKNVRVVTTVDRTFGN
jgi:uncharacterized protein